MADRDTLIELSNLAWATMCESLEGLTQEQSWASVDFRPGEYLHSEGSILSQIAHVAGGKFIYGSVGFLDTEIRWRDLAAKVDQLWPSLAAFVGWLNEAHDYWMKSWAQIDDLEVERSRFNGGPVPGRKLMRPG